MSQQHLLSPAVVRGSEPLLGAKKPQVRGSVDSFSVRKVFVCLFVFSGIDEGGKVGRARS